MFLFQFHVDSLRLLEAERKRNEPLDRHLRELHELQSAATPAREHEAPSPAVSPRSAYTGPERRSVPCPEMKEAMTT